MEKKQISQRPIKTTSSNVKKLFLISWSWMWRFIPVIVAILAIESSLNIPRFYGNYINRQLASVEARNFTVHTLPGNLAIFILGLWFLKISLRRNGIH